MRRHRSRLFAPLIAAPFLALASTAGAQSPPEPAVSVAGRVVAETLMGTGLATVGFLVGPKITGLSCRTCLFASGFAAANATFPLGVYWGGSVARGDGSFWLTVAAPWVVSATAFTALAFDKDYDGKPAIQIAAIGGVIAVPLSVALYEVTHATRRANLLQPHAGLRPHVAVGPKGDSLVVHVTGEF